MISKTFKIYQQQSIKNIKKLGKFQKKLDKLSDQIVERIFKRWKNTYMWKWGTSCDTTES